MNNDIPAGDGKIGNLFNSVACCSMFMCNINSVIGQWSWSLPNIYCGQGMDGAIMGRNGEDLSVPCMLKDITLLSLHISPRRIETQKLTVMSSWKALIKEVGKR